MLDLEPGAVRAGGGRGGAEGDLAGGLDDPADPPEADHAARELTEQPADRADRERDDREQVGDGDHVAGDGGAAEDPAHADREHDQDTDVGQRGQRRVERRPDPTGPDVDVAQLAGLGGEPVGLLALTTQGLDHHRAVEGLVGDLADLGAQLLGPGHQRGREPLVGEVGDDHGREDEQPHDRQHDVGDEHLHDRDHHHRDRADRHRERRDRPPGSLDVGVGVGEQLTGRVPLVPLHREREVLPGDRAAAVRLHAVLHDAGAEPARHDADRAQQRDAEEQRQHRDEQAAVDLAVLERREHDVLGRPAEHPRVGDGQRAEEHAADRGEREDPRLALDRDPEDGEPVEGGGRSRRHTRLAHGTTLSSTTASLSDQPGNRPAPAGYSRPPTGHELIAEGRVATVWTVTEPRWSAASGTPCATPPWLSDPTYRPCAATGPPGIWSRTCWCGRTR